MSEQEKKGTAPKVAVHCRYHIEHTPSMIMNFADNTFHCIGCGAEGSFKENIDGSGFRFMKKTEFDPHTQCSRGAES